MEELNEEIDILDGEIESIKEKRKEGLISKIEEISAIIEIEWDKLALYEETGQVDADKVRLFEDAIMEKVAQFKKLEQEEALA